MDIILKLKQKNPWWQSPLLIEEDEKLKELAALPYPWGFPAVAGLDLSQAGIYTIRGIRQIGKSTVLKRMIRSTLLERGVEPKSVLYFSCEGVHHDRDLYHIIDEYLKEIAPAAGPLFLFIDEVTFVEEWQRAVKELADEGRFARATVVLTGSNLLDLRHSSEQMPGRRGRASMLDICLRPLGFGEFVGLVDPSLGACPLEEALRRQDRLQELFDHYLLCGGIPKAVNEYFSGERRAIPSFIYEIYRSWIVGDILKARKSEAVFEAVVDYLMRSLTTPVSWYKIGKEAHLVSHAAAMDYVELLERMFVALRLEMIDPGTKQPVFRKNKKIYFSDPLIHDALRALVDGFTEESWAHARCFIDDPENLSKKVEQTVISNLCGRGERVFYWLGEQEVDAVVKSPVEGLCFHEVKYQRRVSGREFLWFANRFPKSFLTVYTRRDYEVLGNISCVPACVALACGKEAERKGCSTQREVHGL